MCQNRKIFMSNDRTLTRRPNELELHNNWEIGEMNTDRSADFADMAAAIVNAFICRQPFELSMYIVHRYVYLSNVLCMSNRKQKSRKLCKINEMMKK